MQLFFVDILKANDEKSRIRIRIRIRIRTSVERIRIRANVSRIHNTGWKVYEEENDVSLGKNCSNCRSIMRAEKEKLEKVRMKGKENWI